MTHCGYRHSHHRGSCSGGGSGASASATGGCGTGSSHGGGYIKHTSVISQCGLEVSPIDPYQRPSRDRGDGGVDVLDMGGREVAKHPCDVIT